MGLPFFVGVLAFSVVVLLNLASPSHAFGSSGTLVVVYNSSAPTVCGIVSSGPKRFISCYSASGVLTLEPNISFSSIAGSHGLLCGLVEGSYTLLCWDLNANFSFKRLYHNTSASLLSISVSDEQICGIHGDSNTVQCWRSRLRPSGSERFVTISSGSGYSCGILAVNGTVQCWGPDHQTAEMIQSEFSGIKMTSIACGGAHACGLNDGGVLICKGANSSGQLKVPDGELPFEYSDVTLGSNHTCGVKTANGTIICWGGGFSNGTTQKGNFMAVASGQNFSCGVLSGNLSVACWGPGWPGAEYEILPFTRPTLPRPCVADESTCGQCGVVANSQALCYSTGVICQQCPNCSSAPPPADRQRGRSKALTKGLLAFVIVGSIGTIFGICTAIYLICTSWSREKKVRDSVQPTITRGASNSGSSKSNSGNLFSGSATLRRLGSRAVRRQRSGTSSKHGDRAEEFTLRELAAATNGFSLENKIGAGSFGVVYKGKLGDGKEVAIKRGEIVSSNRARKAEEKASAFESELSFLSRLHHKHLVRLVGHCEDGEERLLVYEFMTNGALYDHLHDKELPANSRVATSWKMRIKLALDAARGIEYLHTYAVPPIIHRDIKSSNILIDDNWTARVSDFGLSLLGSEQSQPMKAAGTIGYIDPEYYGLNVLTVKSDVYGFGVVLLEIITGRRAIFKGDAWDNDDGAPVSLVDYAVPMIMANDLGKILDQRVGLPNVNEAEAVELVANTAMLCVHLEGKDRPTMTDIVANLERALSICEDASHGSISSGVMSASD